MRYVLSRTNKLEDILNYDFIDMPKEYFNYNSIIGINNEDEYKMRVITLLCKNFFGHEYPLYGGLYAIIKRTIYLVYDTTPSTMHLSFLDSWGKVRHVYLIPLNIEQDEEK